MRMRCGGRITIPRLANPAPGTALAAAKRTPAQPVMASAVTESAGLQRSERSERSRQAACYVHGRTPFHGDLEERAGCWKPDYSAACQADALGSAALPATSKLLHGASVLGPRVKSSRVEVGAVGPNEGSNLEVNVNTIEQREVLSGPNSSPERTGRKSITCAEPSSNATRSV